MSGASNIRRLPSRVGGGVFKECATARALPDAMRMGRLHAGAAAGVAEFACCMQMPMVPPVLI